MTRGKSPECIAPSAFDSEERQQSAKVGIFNLISTMIGGGVLSLPYAISRSGVILGFVMLIVSGIASVFSFDILVSASRRTGAMTYQQIAYFAFGTRIQHLITFLICCLTVTGSIAYCVLVGDLVKPIVCYLGSVPDTQCSSEWLRRLVIACGICTVSPFCFMRQIKALQYTSTISMASVSILAAIITYKTAIHFGTTHQIYYMNHNGVKQSYLLAVDIQWFPQSIEDIIYVFPVFSLAFMCHFNIPQVHSELTRPTRRRMRNILLTVVLICSILYIIVSFFGYFYAFQYTCGNILLNYNQDDLMITIARGCLASVILLSFPLFILPARSAMHNLLNLIYAFKSMNMEQNEHETSTYSRSRSERSLSSKDALFAMDSSSDNDPIGYVLFGQNTQTQPHNTAIQVMNKNANISPAKDRSTHSLLSQRVALSYSTFSANTGTNAPKMIMNSKPKIYSENNRNKSVESDDAEDSKTREISYRSTSRGFTTRSFSHLDSPLRGPQDALGVINAPQDIESLQDKDFTKPFPNLDDAKNFRPTKWWLVGETTILIALALTVSFLTDSVMVLWAILGSTVSFLIAFTLPGLFYFKIRYHRKGCTIRNALSLVIVMASSIAIGLCTWQAILRLDAEPCPNIPK